MNGLQKLDIYQSEYQLKRLALLWMFAAITPAFLFQIPSFGGFWIPKEVSFYGLAALISFYSLRTIRILNVYRNTRTLWLSLLAYAVWQVVTITWSPDSRNSFLTLGTSIGGVLMCFFVSALWSQIKSLSRIFIIVILLAAMIQSIYAMSQFVGFDPFGLSEMANGRASIVGTLGYPIFVAEFLMLIFPFCLLAIASQDRYISKLGWAAGILITAVLLLSKTRGVWIGWVLQIICFQILRFVKNTNKDRKTVWKSFLPILVLLTLGGFMCFGITSIAKLAGYHDRDPSFSSRLVSSLDLQSVQNVGRKIIWATATRIIGNAPFFGHGAGSFRYQYVENIGNTLEDFGPNVYLGIKDSGDAAVTTEYAHNEYLQLWAETGVIGVMSFAIAMGYFFYIGVKKVRRTLDKNYFEMDDAFYRSDLLTACISSVVSLLIEALVNFPFHVPSAAALFWFILGIGIACCNTKARVESSHVNGHMEELKVIGWYRKAMSALAFLVIIQFVVGIPRLIASQEWALALVNSQEGRSLEEAIRRYQRAVKLDPWNARLRFYYASALLKSGKVSEGVQMLKDVEKGFRDINLYQNMGRALLETGNVEQAEFYYSKAYASRVNFLENANNLAIVQMKQGKVKEAYEILSQALTLAPDDSKSIGNQTVAMIRGSIKGSERNIATLIENENISSDILLPVGIALIQAKRYQEAETVLNSILKREPNSVPALNNLAAVNYLTGNNKLANSYWNHVLVLDPLNDTATKNLTKLE